MQSRPHVDSQPALRAALAACQSCGLWEQASQVVPGLGPQHAKLMLVGEQPGNDEDIAGEPFVGPAGRLLRDALHTASIPDEQVYFTNAVKHFKWVAKGPRRIHKRASASEIRTCSHWLGEEVRLVQPQLIVCLGATAGQAVVGNHFRVNTHRGRPLASPLGAAFATMHPSAILRMPDRAMQARALRELVDDLRCAWEMCQTDAVQTGRVSDLAATPAEHVSSL